jgi:hypothetical protein
METTQLDDKYMLDGLHHSMDFLRSKATSCRLNSTQSGLQLLEMHLVRISALSTLLLTRLRQVKCIGLGQEL